MEQVKVSKTFHYRTFGEWNTVRAGDIIDKNSVPELKLEASGYESVETPKSLKVKVPEQERHDKALDNVIKNIKLKKKAKIFTSSKVFNKGDD